MQSDWDTVFQLNTSVSDLLQNYFVELSLKWQYIPNTIEQMGQNVVLRELKWNEVLNETIFTFMCTDYVSIDEPMNKF